MARKQTQAPHIVDALRRDRTARYQTIADRVAVNLQQRVNVNHVRSLASQHNLLRGRAGDREETVLVPPTELPDDWYEGMAGTSQVLSPAVQSDNPRSRVRPLGSLRTPEDLLDGLDAIGEIGGATQSPFVLGGGVVLAPETGYCVALSGSDLKLSPVLVPGRSDPDVLGASAEFGEFRRWHQTMTPYLAHGRTWIGMWRDDASGELEVNVTMVVEDEQVALALARSQDQKAVYHLDTEETIQAGGTGGPGWSPELPSALHVPEREELEELLTW